jgi:uncharacterized protein (TIGR03118 family)
MGTLYLKYAIMKEFTKTNKQSISNGFLLTILILIFVAGCQKHTDHQALKEFRQENLVANNNEYSAPHVDPTLLNAWGLAWSPTGIAWVNAQAGHVSEVYDNEGNIVRPPVSIPSPGGTTGGNPTGIVFNSGGSSSFMLGNKQKALFLFVGVDGVLSGWNGALGNNAQLIQNNSSMSAYTGLAIGKANGGQDFLYAADFHAGRIQVWNSGFAAEAMSFKDPALPAGYAPFNIQNIEGQLYVAYALVGPDGRDLPGVGNGIVSVFNTDGSFVRRFATGGLLNSPWGLVKAPDHFFADTDDGGLENVLENGIHNRPHQPAILVGNFGNGRINAYSLDGKFMGQLKTDSKVITIEKLWALSFAPSTATAIDSNRLYFTAGPDNESDGLFGFIIKQ